MSRMPLNLYTIPSGLGFADHLARELLRRTDGEPAALSRCQVLLPTRRAARTMREAFLKITDGRPLLLPRFSPIGDVDDDELAFGLAGVEVELSVPPALSPLRRQFMLAKLVAGLGHGQSLEYDLSLAKSLGQLLDQIHTENLDFADLPNLVDRDLFADHWQVSLDFLSILSAHWPGILAEHGVIDGADRRNRLLGHLADFWQEHPPGHPVIAAGTTGSIPATARLLKTVAGMKDGCVVLPGLDHGMDQESWDTLDDTHPQATLRHLLHYLDTPREAVDLWPGCEAQAAATAPRRAFCTELMRPSSTAQQWQVLKQQPPLAPGDLPIQRYDCANVQEEALVIAFALRETIETPGMTAAVVTPDRALARRIGAACRRWGFEVDDSAGQPLHDTGVGLYLRLMLEAACAGLTPVALLSFCKHALCLPQEAHEWRGAVRALDHDLLRGPVFKNGLSDYRRKLALLEAKGRIERAEIDALAATLNVIERGFAPLSVLFESSAPASFETWYAASLEAAEYFCAPEILWRGHDGEAAANFLASLRECADLIPALSGAEFAKILQTAMRDVAVRPVYGRHPRVMILGQLEARMVQADRMILAGLNEGTWPAGAKSDPWMSRPMRKRFGLPSPERSTGLSAHDFVQAFGAGDVILTRAVRVDGTPTVPSRWLQRLDTVLTARGAHPAEFYHGPLLGWARQLDHAEMALPGLARPAPRPPREMRPRRLSATRIETWMLDPYSIYAKYILRLNPLDPLERPLDPALRGELTHKVMERFTAAYPDEIDEDCAERFIAIAREELDNFSVDPDVRAFWEPKFLNTGGWIAKHERAWRMHYRPVGREAKGEITIAAAGGPFTLTARADRIDRSRDGTAFALIDYKSGGSYSQIGMKNGVHPQLPLEALILEQGGFAGLGSLPAKALSYWVLSGREGAKEYGLADPADVALARDNAEQGLKALIDAFDNEAMPYYSLPRLDRRPRFNEYEHLARVLEWTALGDQEE